METVTRIPARLAPDCDVVAFGSRLKGNARKYSHPELANRGEGSLDFSRYAQLRLAFEESTMPINVDFLDWHSIPARFQENIEQGSVLIQEGTGQYEKTFPVS